MTEIPTGQASIEATQGFEAVLRPTCLNKPEKQEQISRSAEFRIGRPDNRFRAGFLFQRTFDE